MRVEDPVEPWKTLCPHQEYTSPQCVFLFTDNGLMLTQKRAYSKKTWLGIWSNACCGHPAPGESQIKAAKRRLKY